MGRSALGHHGTKRWITNGTMAQLAVVWAKTDGSRPDSIAASSSSVALLVFRAREMEGKFSMRMSDTAELVLDDVAGAAENMLPQAEGLQAP